LGQNCGAASRRTATHRGDDDEGEPTITPSILRAALTDPPPRNPSNYVQISTNLKEVRKHALEWVATKRAEWWKVRLLLMFPEYFLNIP
jgi:hypothetical protein